MRFTLYKKNQDKKNGFVLEPTVYLDSDDWFKVLDFIKNLSIVEGVMVIDRKFKENDFMPSTYISEVFRAKELIYV